MLKAGTQAIARSEMSPAESSASLDLVVMLAQGLEDPLNFLENALNRLVVDLKGSLSEENAHILDHATCSADSLRLFVSQSQDMKLIMSRKPLMPNKNYVSLQSVIEKVMKVTEDTSQTVPIVFENRCGPDVVLWTDGEWLWQMLASAVIDACKTTFEGKIDVNICATGCGHLRFDIIDTGVHRVRTASEAFRLNTAMYACDTNETGLGMHILRERVKALGGVCGVRKNPWHRTGSVCWFRIPFQKPFVLDCQEDLVDFSSAPRNRSEGVQSRSLDSIALSNAGSIAGSPGVRCAASSPCGWLGSQRKHSRSCEDRGLRRAVSSRTSDLPSKYAGTITNINSHESEPPASVVGLAGGSGTALSNGGEQQPIMDMDIGRHPYENTKVRRLSKDRFPAQMTEDDDLSLDCVQSPRSMNDSDSLSSWEHAAASHSPPCRGVNLDACAFPDHSINNEEEESQQGHGYNSVVSYLMMPGSASSSECPSTCSSPEKQPQLKRSKSMASPRTAPFSPRNTSNIEHNMHTFSPKKFTLPALSSITQELTCDLSDSSMDSDADGSLSPSPRPSSTPSTSPRPLPLPGHGLLPGSRSHAASTRSFLGDQLTRR